MATTEINVTVDTVSCQADGCSNSDNMVVITTFTNRDGYMVAGQQRLPDDWCKIIKLNSGNEVLFKVYCPTCAANL